MNVYDPHDPNSSPYEPAMGNIVIYRLKQGEHYPAIITKAHAGDKVDITVFTTTGLLYRQRVQYSGDESTINTWYWAPAAKERKTVVFDAAKPELEKVSD